MKKFHPIRLFGIAFILVLIIIIIFFSRQNLSTGKAFQANLGPSSTTTSLACDGDIVCEMNGANILQTLISGGVITGRLTVTGNTLVSGDFVGASKVSGSSIQGLTLGGKGNAYACLDSSGNLYRSTKPCI